MKRIFVPRALLVVLSAHAAISEMPQAHNVVMLNNQASGLAFVCSAPAVTMKKAAEAALSRGYTPFQGVCTLPT